MSRILVIGRSGQVAQALAHVGGERVHCAGRGEADLLDPDSLAGTLDRYTPSAVINTGAYTSVDAAEAEPDLCRALNVDGPAALARACAARGIPLVHLSTDCVFDGTKDAPYTPTDAPAPLGVYGQTKLEGEQAVRQLAEKSLVVRVSWIFSRFGGNFVRTMLRVAGSRDEVSVVDDQYGCPTHAPDLAAALLEIAGQIARPDFSAWGIYHLAGAGMTERADMARQIFEVSARIGGPSARVIPVATADYPTPAQRPLNARLDMSETTRVFGVSLPDWRDGLEQAVPVLVEELRA